MVIGLGQIDVRWKDRRANFDKLEALLSQCDVMPDVLILPEMYDVGYLLSSEDLEVSDAKKSIALTTSLAKKYGTVIGGSLPTLRNGKYYNTFYFIDESGPIHTYDKIHLFSPAGENRTFCPGHQADDAVVKDVRMRTQICYDLRFPFKSFNDSAYDVLIYSANWPVGRIHHWRSLLIGRAIENQATVIGVNRIGKDHNGYSYPGHSLVADHHGRVVLDADESEGIFCVEIDLKEQNLYRSQYPFIGDAVG